MSGDNLYPAPTLQVFPGRDADRPSRQRARPASPSGISSIRNIRRRARRCRSIPPMMTSSPINLHIHGVHVSPKGNADNVMLHIPAGMSNTYTYHIPKNMPQGAYWYHSHLHGLTTPHVYYGLAGLLAIGRTDGNIPLVTQNADPDPQHGAAIQLRVRPRGRTARRSTTVLGRNGSARSSRRKATSWRRARIARCSRRSISAIEEGNAVLHQSGTRGRWSIRQLCADDSSSFRATCSASPAEPAVPAGDVPADPSLPDYKRDVQFTVNGQFQPVIKSKAGTDRDLGARQYQRHRLHAACSSPRRRPATTRRSPSSARTGIPYPAVHYPVFENGTRLVIPPATRYAIAVTMPDEGDLVLEMPPRGGGARTIERPGHPLHQ